MVVSCHTMNPNLKTSELLAVEYFLEGDRKLGLLTIDCYGPSWGLLHSPFKAHLIRSTTSSLKKDNLVAWFSMVVPHSSPYKHTNIWAGLTGLLYTLTQNIHP